MTTEQEIAANEPNYAETIDMWGGITINDDPRSIIMGAGAADHKHVFGTTKSAHEKDANRVVEIPISETMLTGALVGMAMNDWSPILVHQRMDFATLSVEQLVNTAAKFQFMGAEMRGIMVRAIIGQGWGNGPQHTQNFSHWFANVPGLDVWMPATPDGIKRAFDSYRRGNTVFVGEHRRLFSTTLPPCELPFDEKPEAIIYTVGAAYLDAIKAQPAFDRPVAIIPIEHLSTHIIDDVLAVTGYDEDDLEVPSVVVDCGPGAFGASAEICAQLNDLGILSHRVAPPHVPVPTSRQLEAAWYPSPVDIANGYNRAVGNQAITKEIIAEPEQPREGAF